MPLVSVIIPTYNRKNLVCEAIDSVLAQTFKDYEIIVIDDGSTDDTQKELMKYGDKIRYIFQKNAGLSAARNTGIRKMKGQYAAFLDDDDRWLPNKLSVQMTVFKKDENIDLVSTRAAVINERAERIGQYKPEGFFDANFEGILKHNHIIVSSVVMKRKVLARCGLFDEKLQCCEDYELWLRMAALGISFYYIDECLMEYRLTESALSRSLFRIYSTSPYIFNKLVEKCSFKQEELLRQKFRNSYYMLSKEYFKRGNVFNCLKYYLLSKMIVFNKGI